MYQRSALKQQTKRLVGQGTPPVYLVTLVFILATTWVSQLLDLFFTNPIANMTDVVNSWTETISRTGTMTESTVNAMMQQILAGFRAPGAMFVLLAALLIAFYSMVVSLGYNSYTLRVMRGQEAGYGDLFSQFYLAGRMILLQVLKFIFIYLWSLLFVIPGIVAAYRYRLAEYALLDDPEVSALGAIRRSKALMNGRKMDLFVTDLSFLGWVILNSLVCEGVYMLLNSLTGQPSLASVVSLIANTAINMFLLAYQNLTYAGFYLFVLGNQVPPVQPGDGFNRPQPPSSGGSEGWNQ